VGGSEGLNSLSCLVPSRWDQEKPETPLLGDMSPQTFVITVFSGPRINAGSQGRV